MQNSLIHPSAIIEPGAKLASDVAVGPFSYIGSDVVLNSKVQIKKSCYRNG